MKKLRSACIKQIVIFWTLLIICKISFAQGERWIYSYNGKANEQDVAYSIVYGADGNIYAAGEETTGSDTYLDFAVIGLTTAGDTNWTYRYDGPSSEADRIHSLVYGLDGNLYAAGLSTGNGFANHDFVVISLTSTGEERWVYRYDGSANDQDEARSIVYGTDGNIYAAGWCESIGTNADFLVISLTTDGDTNWTYLYDGPPSHSDHANSIVYGTDGNIYAAGWSHMSSDSTDDLLVVSLTSTGVERWTYNPDLDCGDRANSIVYGLDGHLYITGHGKDSTGTQERIIVISLTSTGEERWVHRSSGGEEGISIIYGLDGNIYAACDGSCFTVISLTSTGKEQWVYRYDGPGGGGAGNRANSIVYGADGNLYAAGYTNGSSWSADFTVISLTSTGKEQWIYSYNGSADRYDNVYSIVYGADGNIYAAGRKEDADTQVDFIVVSLDPTIGIEEAENTTVEKNDFGATIISGPLLLPEDKKCKVFDITGRTVIPDKIKPGIYFIEIEGHITQKVIKVR